MPAKLISPGSRFGRWTVVCLADQRIHSQLAYVCRCDCGTEKAIAGGELRRGKTRGCRGCANRRLKTKHGHASGTVPSPEYAAWQAMQQRCYQPTARQFRNYGARGIKVCQRWRESFEAFLQDMGLRPSSEHSLDRIDNDGHYEPGNCRWATRTQQQRNRRNNRRLTIDGQTFCVTTWAERVGLEPSVIFDRLRKGWSAKQAVYGKE